MPNEVYQQTRERLADIVSARAAERVLNDAMSSRGYSPESISTRQMKQMLMGPVLRDLESILPRAGLKRNLREVGKVLEMLSVPDDAPVRPAVALADDPLPPTASRGAAPAPAAPTFQLEADDDRLWTRPAGFITPPRPVAPSPPVAIAEDESPEAESEIVVDMDPLPSLPVTPGVRLVGEIADASLPVLAEPLSTEQLQAAVLHFAKIESVQQVAALRRDGEVVEARGHAVDLGSLGLLISSSMALLRRHGSIRSYYLLHDRGQMFLFPIGRDTIVVVGQTNLNLGAVFTALAALEEEL